MKYLLNIGNTHTTLAQYDTHKGISLLQTFYTENFSKNDLPEGEIADIEQIFHDNFSIILVNGINKATTIEPTIPARATIINGSIREVRALTALSTSSS